METKLNDRFNEVFYFHKAYLKTLFSKLSISTDEDRSMVCILINYIIPPNSTSFNVSLPNQFRI